MNRNNNNNKNNQRNNNQGNNGQNQGKAARRRRNRQRKQQQSSGAQRGVQNPAVNLGGRIGQRVGTAVQNAVQSRAGRVAASMLSKISGMGDYVVNGAVRYNTLAGMTPPTFGTIGGMTRMRHREYIGDVSGSTLFTTRTYPLNPGMKKLFPWLASMANRFEQYRFHGLVIEFKSTSADALNSVNTALGTVSFVTQYDPSDPPFVNKLQLENYEGAQSCKPSDSMLHAVECAPGTAQLEKYYTRPAGIASTEDLKFYDLGTVTLATSGMQAAAVIGELWVSYDVEFYKPKAPQYGGGSDTQMDYYRIGSFVVADTAGIPYGGKPFSDNLWQPHHDMLGTTATVQTITWPAAAPRGSYFVSASWRFKRGPDAGVFPLTKPTLANPVPGGNGVSLRGYDVGFGGPLVSDWPGLPATTTTGYPTTFQIDSVVRIDGAGVATLDFPINLGGDTYFYDCTLLVILIPDDFNVRTVVPTSTSQVQDDVEQVKDNLVALQQRFEKLLSKYSIEEESKEDESLFKRKQSIESMELIESLPEEDAKTLLNAFKNSPGLMNEIKMFINNKNVSS